MSDQTEIRKHIRQQRRALTTTEQLNAATHVFQHVRQSNLLYKHQRFACYLANQGEIDPHHIIHRLWQLKKECALPILHWSKKNKLEFMPFYEDTTLIHNRYGILEPQRIAKNILPAFSFDVLFMPLVAFDTHGNRIGMGGGYYDRTLSFLNNRTTWKKPKLVGLAYEFQKVPNITTQPWDIPLDLIITEKHIYTPK